MITVAQREKLEELIDEFSDAKADYVCNGGSQACNWVSVAERELSDFLDGITEVKK